MKMSKLIMVLFSGLLLNLLSPFALQVRATVVTCQLQVPSNPLTSIGLATPWIIQQPCLESVSNNSVFVQAVIFDFVKHKLTTYSPLVISQGTTPAVIPSVPKISSNSVVAIWGGGNDDVTQLVGSGSTSCVNGAGGIPFGQVFFCNAQQFFAAIHQYGVGVPDIGTGIDGKPCPTTRSFKVVDQDPSDNVQTTYLLLSNGQTAQNTFNNRNSLSGYTIIANPSDNRVLTNFIDPALHCTPMMIPDIADNGTLEPTQATDELQAMIYQQGVTALVPAGDPMVGPNNLAMLNAYRQGVDQPTVNKLGGASTLTYCHNLKNIQPGFLNAHKALFKTQPSPVPSIGNNLYTFMEARLAASFQILMCP